MSEKDWKKAYQVPQETDFEKGKRIRKALDAEYERTHRQKKQMDKLKPAFLREQKRNP